MSSPPHFLFALFSRPIPLTERLAIVSIRCPSLEVDHEPRSGPVFESELSVGQRELLEVVAELFCHVVRSLRSRPPLLLQMVPLTAAVVKGYQRKKDAGGHKTPRTPCDV